jgi:hypothetical protein
MYICSIIFFVQGGDLYSTRLTIRIFRQSNLHMPLGRRMQRTISTEVLMRELKALFRVRFRVDNACAQTFRLCKLWELGFDFVE